MTKEQAIEKIKWSIHISELTKSINGSNASINIEVLKKVLSMLEEKEKIIGLYIDNIMTHQQVKTIRKMCCPSCPIGEKACTYSGIHRNCIKQYFENKAKELLNK